MLLKPLLALLIALPLVGCAPELFVGWGLPRNDACNDASVFPGKPIGNDCLDSLHGAP